MPGKNTWNNWVVFGIALIIGLLIGWLLQDLLNPTIVHNGASSTYNQDSGKVSLVVPPGSTGIITSTMFGPQKKSVRVMSLTTGALVPISDYTPATPTLPPGGMNVQTCATGKDAVSWNLPAGNYQIMVGYDHSSGCDGAPTISRYALWPTVIASTARIIATDGTVRYCPMDTYFFDAACSPDDGTKIVIVMMPGM